MIAAAQDTGGEAAAGEWYDQAKATYTTLLDTEHSISSLYHMSNVPAGVWINEDGRMVRPVEPASTANKTLKLGDQTITTMGDTYVAALRDWVEKGEAPKQIVARGTAVFPGRSRPLCPHPQYAHYKGQGNIEDAASFECR